MSIFATTLNNERASSPVSMSSQGSTEESPIISSQAPVFSQEASFDSQNVPKPTAESLSRKRKGVPTSDVALSTGQPIVTPPPKPGTHSPSTATSSVSTGRVLQLQPRDTAEVFKMNEDILSVTSDLFKYKLFREFQPPISPPHGDNAHVRPHEALSGQNPVSDPASESTIPSTPISSHLPLVPLNTTLKALFLYCLWRVAPPDRLSSYLDSTISRPSQAFTIYLYEAFLLALELRDSTFFTNIVSIILKDKDAGWPREEAITWVYENTGPEQGELLREFVVDITVTWVDEDVGKWRTVAGMVSKEFVVDVSCRLIELRDRRGSWLKSDVATKYTWNDFGSGLVPTGGRVTGAGSR